MSRAAPALERLVAGGVLTPLDRHFAQSLAELAGETDARVLLAAALVSRQVQAGHVCLDLRALCRGELAIDGLITDEAAPLPELDGWLEAVRRSTLTGAESEASPLCLDPSGRLYLRRYLEHEQSIARALRIRAAMRPGQVDRRRLHAGLDRLFGKAEAAQKGQLDLFASEEASTKVAAPDQQRNAAERAVLLSLVVISGGPGTGKTSTVVKILALLVEQALAHGAPPPRAHLLAPTGKAAARLSEAIRDAKAKLPLREEVRAAIAENASTIHRALGAVKGRARFAHDHETPLAADVVVVDEASMVDVALMARLLDAVPTRARLILLGDKNQLASVEAGAVLGDICGVGAEPARPLEAPLSAAVVQLDRSYRYDEHSGIRQLADAINRSDADTALRLLSDPRVPDVRLVDTTEQDSLERELLPHALDRLTAFFDAREPLARLEALDRFRVLCAHRHGPSGQVNINAKLEAAATRAGLIAPKFGRYAGRPILITENDPRAQLFNGDVGVLLESPERDHSLRAFFRAPLGAVRGLGMSRLPPHESVYAMSVHKSQGSEFDAVAVVLPAEPSPVLSRELLYTAVTRARQSVTIYASAAIIRLAIGRAVQRASGLREKLWAR